jgi:hypothetical protein
MGLFSLSHQRKIYHSENGDSWWLCFEENGRVCVLHDNALSGGKATKLEIANFLSQGKVGPEHQAFIRMLGELAKVD